MDKVFNNIEKLYNFIGVDLFTEKVQDYPHKKRLIFLILIDTLMLICLIHTFFYDAKINLSDKLFLVGVFVGHMPISLQILEAPFQKKQYFELKQWVEDLYSTNVTSSLDVEEQLAYFKCSQFLSKIVR